MSSAFHFILGMRLIKELILYIERLHAVLISGLKNRGETETSTDRCFVMFPDKEALSLVSLVSMHEEKL